MKTCEIDGCEGKRIARGWCHKHYKRWQKYGDPTVVNTVIGRPPCSVAGCERDSVGKGLCNTHYMRMRAGKDLSAPIRGKAPNGTYAGAVCSVSDCVGTHWARGYCDKHYKRWYVHGDIGRGVSEAQAPDAPAIVYIVKHPHLGAGKVGIGDPDGRRVREHTARGWQVVWLSATMTRAEARQVEKALLSIPARLGVLGPDDMPQSGWTETFDEGDIWAIVGLPPE